MIEVSIEDAYREACLALGEAIVRERLMTAALAKRSEPVTDRNGDHIPGLSRPA